MSDSRGRIPVDETYRTNVEHIYAVGDVVGFPALAATSMEQGRLAALHAMGETTRSLTALQPIGIYTIPEISYVGATESELTEQAVPYEVGLSRYRELARGQIVGDSYGMLKLIVHAIDRTILGVHIFGTGATDLVHIGQAVMGCGGTVDYLVDTVFNYPTLSESYKVAALDATNKLRTLDRLLGLRTTEPGATARRRSGRHASRPPLRPCARSTTESRPATGITMRPPSASWSMSESGSSRASADTKIRS